MSEPINIPEFVPTPENVYPKGHPFSREVQAAVQSGQTVYVYDRETGKCFGTVVPGPPRKTEQGFEFDVIPAPAHESPDQ